VVTYLKKIAKLIENTKKIAKYSFIILFFFWFFTITCKSKSPEAYQIEKNNKLENIKHVLMQEWNFEFNRYRILTSDNFLRKLLSAFWGVFI
jgi:hypothetical protein